MPFLPQRPEDKPYQSETCIHPEHNPPTMIVLQPGIHRYQCPACKHITTFHVKGRYTLREDNKVYENKDVIWKQNFAEKDDKAWNL